MINERRPPNGGRFVSEFQNSIYKNRKKIMIITKIKKGFSWLFTKIGMPKAKRFYYFVPQCPVCGSWHTGRYVKRPLIDPEYMERKSLEAGELIRFAEREPLRNCYCEDCGTEWASHLEAKLMTVDEVMEQSRIRGVNNALNEYKSKYYIHGKPPKPSAFNRWFL